MKVYIVKEDIRWDNQLDTDVQVYTTYEKAKKEYDERVANSKKVWDDHNTEYTPYDEDEDGKRGEPLHRSLLYTIDNEYGDSYWLVELFEIELQ